MTFALASALAALLAWPAEAADAQRIVALRLARRLAPAPARRRSRLGWPAGGRPAARLGSMARFGRGVLAVAVTALVVILTPSLGPVAAVEFALCVLVVGLVALSLGRRTVDGRRQLIRLQQVALAIALAAGELEAGASTADAMRAAAEVDPRISAALVGALDTGRDHLDDAGPSAVTVDDPLARVVVAWQASSSTGAPLAALLARARADLADALATRRELRAAVAGPQATALVLALLPVLGVMLGSAIGAAPVTVLFATSVGRVLLCLGVLLEAAGVAWTLRLIARAQR